MAFINIQKPPHDFQQETAAWIIPDFKGRGSRYAEQFREFLERLIHPFPAQYLFGKHFPELYAFLIEGVDIPQKP